MPTCPQCGHEAQRLQADARSKPVCPDCCQHDYAWGTCKFCGRSWGLAIKFTPRKEDTPR